MLNPDSFPRALQLILDCEGCANHPEWPGGASGITIGYGYDLGYVELDQFKADWGRRLSVPEVMRLRTVVGMRGNNARDCIGGLRDIIVDDDAARSVFINRSIPRAVKDTEAAFPGVDALPPEAAGALVSLVYNRGGATHGPRREEMAAIRDLVPDGDLAGIAAQIRAMKRYWNNGLVNRREREAQLVESCIVKGDLK